MQGYDAGADLRLDSSAHPSPAAPGSWVVYVLTAANAGPEAARDVRLTCALPASLCHALCSEDWGGRWLPWTGTLRLGVLAPGEERRVLVAGMVPGRPPPVLVCSAAAASPTPDPRLAGNTATLVTPVRP